MDILIDGVIGRDVKSKTIKNQLSRNPNEKATVRISSRGGDFMEAISIFNALKEHAGGVEGVIEGPCFSAAAVISMACDTLKMKNNTLLMFHNVKVVGKALDINELEAVKESLTKHQEILVNTLASKMQKSKEEIENFLSQEKLLRPMEAKLHGLVDEVIEVNRGRMSIFNFFDRKEDAPKEVLEYVNEFNKRSDSMALRDVVNTLEISIENLDDKTEDSVIEEAIVNSFQSLTARISELEEAAKDKKDNDDDLVVNVTGTMINVVQEYRETKIDNLVSKGKLTPAAAKVFKAKHCSEEVAKASYIDEGVKNSFDAAIEVIEANDAVINFGGKTGVQPVPKESGDSEVLSRLMEKKFATS